MRWRQRLELAQLGSSFGKECIQINSVGFCDLFDGADAYAQHPAGFKALVILEGHADQIGGLFLTKGGLGPELAQTAGDELRCVTHGEQPCAGRRS